MPVAVPGSRPQSVTTVSPHRRPVAGRCRTTWPTGATAPLLGSARPHRAGLTGELDGRVGLGLQVEPPGRLRVRPAVHRQRDQVRAVLDVPDDDAAGPASAAARRRQPQRAPAVRPGAPQPHPATGDPVDRAVGRPGETDDEARRKPRTTLAGVGHTGSLPATVGPFASQPGRPIAGRVALPGRPGGWKHSRDIAVTTRYEAVAVDRQMVARTVHELRAALPEADELLAGLLRVAEATRTALEVDGAGLTLVHEDGLPRSVAATDTTTELLEQVQHDFGDGPIYRPMPRTGRSASRIWGPRPAGCASTPWSAGSLSAAWSASRSASPASRWGPWTSTASIRGPGPPTSWRRWPSSRSWPGSWSTPRWSWPAPSWRWPSCSRP